MIIYRIATIASGPKAAIFSGVKAETTDENIRAGRLTFYHQSTYPVGSRRKELTRLMKPTPFANWGGKAPFFVMRYPSAIQIIIFNVGAKAVHQQISVVHEYGIHAPL